MTPEPTHVPKVKVTVEYVDTKGNELSPSVQDSVPINSVYIPTVPTIRSYHLITRTPLSYIIIKDTDIQIIYDKNDDKYYAILTDYDTPLAGLHLMNQVGDCFD